MDMELLAFLFAAAVRFSGLPAVEAAPPIRAMPYQAMLREVCADLRAEVPFQQARHRRCLREHRGQPAVCEGLSPLPKMRQYDQCIGQHGLVAAYIIEQRRIVYRDDLDLDDDADNSFIVHEYVHALQHRRFGDRMFDTCQGVLALERQAYQAQQRYLNYRGQLLRVGDRLRYVTCRDIR